MTLSDTSKNTFNLDAFKTLLDTQSNFLLVFHKDPDLDAIGSTMALYHYLLSLGKNVTIWCEDKIEKNNMFLKDSKKITHVLPKPEATDALIFLDCANTNRVFNVHKLTPFLDAPSITTVNIDHHADNPLYGDIVLFKIVSSVGELLHDIFTQLNVTLSKTMATCLYTAIAFDTNRFLYDNTTTSTFKAAIDCIDHGADNVMVNKKMYEEKSYETFKAIQIAIDNLVILHKKKIAFTTLPLNMPSSDIKLIDFVRQIKDMEVVIVFQEYSPGVIKINFRSKGDFNVRLFANQFGGGGHDKAAGLTLDGTLESVKTMILEKLSSQLQA